MIPVLIIFFTTFVIITCLMILVQALVQTELEIARQSLSHKHAALTQQEQEIEDIKKRHNVLMARINELESSRQDLFNYVVKQERLLEDARERGYSVQGGELPLNNGTPLV